MLQIMRTKSAYFEGQLLSSCLPPNTRNLALVLHSYYLCAIVRTLNEVSQENRSAYIQSLPLFIREPLQRPSDSHFPWIHTSQKGASLLNFSPLCCFWVNSSGLVKTWILPPKEAHKCLPRLSGFFFHNQPLSAERFWPFLRQVPGFIFAVTNQTGTQHPFQVSSTQSSL